MKISRYKWLSVVRVGRGLGWKGVVSLGGWTVVRVWTLALVHHWMLLKWERHLIRLFRERYWRRLKKKKRHTPMIWSLLLLPHSLCLQVAGEHYQTLGLVSFS